MAFAGLCILHAWVGVDEFFENLFFFFFGEEFGEYIAAVAFLVHVSPEICLHMRI